MSQTPKEILQKYGDKLAKAVGANVGNVTNALHAKDLIMQDTKEYVVTTVGVTNADKANRLMLDVSNQLEASLDEKEYLVKVCNVLTQQGGAIKAIGNAMLQELGSSGASALPGTKELNMAAVTKIFRDSAHHYMLIGAGLGVPTGDLAPIPGAAQTNLLLLLQRWFDANKNVTWDALRQLCGDYPQLGRAGAELEKYLSQ